MSAESKEVVTIPGQQFFKSLGRLEALAKGVESADDLEKAQLFHTSSSERTGWPGGKKHGIGNNWDDSIGKDGTDYQQARKSIADKIAKGEPLTADDITFLKSAQEYALSKGEGQEVEDGGGKGAPGKEGQEVCKGDKDPDKPASEERDKAFKSLSEGNETLQAGVELSPFLSEMVKAFDNRFAMTEEFVKSMIIESTNAILGQVGEFVEGKFDEQGEFNKSLAAGIVDIGHAVAGNVQMTEEMANAPAGPPKSHLTAVPGGVQAIEKSFGGPQGGNENISKAMILGEMSNMMEKGEINSLEVIKFETTEQIRPDLRAQICQKIKAGGQ